MGEPVEHRRGVGDDRATSGKPSESQMAPVSYGPVPGYLSGFISPTRGPPSRCVTSRLPCAPRLGRKTPPPPRGQSTPSCRPATSFRLACHPRYPPRHSGNIGAAGRLSGQAHTNILKWPHPAASEHGSFGLRALSPAVNDPTTATEVVLRIGSVLRRLLVRDLPPEAVAGPAGRVLLRPWTLNREWRV